MHFSGANVSITDRDVALQTIHKNVQRNIVVPTQNSLDDVECATTKSYDASDLQSCHYTKPVGYAMVHEINADNIIVDGLRHGPDVRELTWGSDRFFADFTQQFDVILGADIVYIEDTFADLIQTITHLSLPREGDKRRTLTLIAARLRYERDSKFFTLLAEYFNVDEVAYDSAREVHIYQAFTKISTTRKL